MSLKSFFHDIFSKIGEIFHNLAPQAKAALHFGTTMVENIKSAVENPGVVAVAGLLTQLIPGDTDEKVVTFVEKNIASVAVGLGALDAATAEGLTPDEVAAKLTAFVQTIDKEYRKDFYNTLAVRLGLISADGKVTWDELQTTMKWYYDTKIAKKPIAISDTSAPEETIANIPAVPVQG